MLDLEFEFQGRGPRNGGWNEAGGYTPRADAIRFLEDERCLANMSR